MVREFPHSDIILSESDSGVQDIVLLMSIDMVIQLF
jgi:hypothetical protein